MRSLSVIIPAAGSGVRMGSDTPKPFIEVGGRPLLEHTVSRFLKSELVGQIIIATSSAYIEVIEEFEILRQQPDEVQIKVVEGGRERQYSIYNALQHVADAMELVAVHDAVRPFIRPELIERCVKAAAEHGGAVVGVPAKDTIKEVDKNALVLATPDRSRLWQAQTPQVFRKELLLKAYDSAFMDDFLGTDDASLVERIGGHIKMVEGDRENLKITYPIDLKIAELILASES